jgi:hypothetical protein
MEKQTAMMQLKEKLQTVVAELKDAEPGTDQYGYRSAMENVIKDIDAQMLAIEKQQIVDAFNIGFEDGYLAPLFEEKFTQGEQYYTETFKTKEEE